ncbi:DUF3301 domain-containing protein [Aromatoleum toluvorans]|uniref:DUF3301 domain-containing protein n=1 Tax=Aromatoleum toluvorans TaxID=92002 RepID=A0ABX1PW74_9RHOO|nr:DUF3301 domain-containing protein [Aromatoleum toluvorans]NMG42761.1 DUF3301 domain-containing protein [Aromatoleum toluvorans]
MSFAELLALMLLCLCGWFWLDGVRTREIGVQAARAACRREGVQFLDETVSSRSFRLVRDEDGRLCPQRVYEFEYSVSGNDRVRGSVMLRGKEVVMIEVGQPPAPVFTLH